MPFDQSTLTSVTEVFVPPSSYRIAWTSTSPAGTWWQLYLGSNLAWVGQRNYTTVPVPQSRVRVNVGAVPAGQEYVNFSSELPAVAADYAELSWEGGTFEGADTAGFNIYLDDAPGGAVDYSVILDSITAYPGGFVDDGFGLGGFGDGGFGEAASYYSWTSGELSSGLWTFAVVPYDANGNLGTAATVQISICSPPSEPAVISGMARMTYTYSASTHEASLEWGVATP